MMLDDFNPVDDIAAAAAEAAALRDFRQQVKQAAALRNGANKLNERLYSQFADAAQRLNLRISVGSALVGKKGWLIDHRQTQDVFLLGQSTPDGGLRELPETPELTAIRQALNLQAGVTLVVTSNFKRVGGRPMIC